MSCRHSNLLFSVRQSKDLPTHGREPRSGRGHIDGINWVKSIGYCDERCTHCLGCDVAPPGESLGAADLPCGSRGWTLV